MLVFNGSQRHQRVNSSGMIIVLRYMAIPHERAVIAELFKIQSVAFPNPNKL
ncbi:hypothetical protein Z945_3443 [Sulfitobacter noctilucae]|nr:hypothetical protein Z945_3443 [Sulfitobacter noctilucae]